MNELNYASLEASKRLVDAGIVLETDASRIEDPLGGWNKRVLPTQMCKTKYQFNTRLPAPSMAEVWRELPEGFKYEGEWAYLCVTKSRKRDNTTYASYYLPNDAAVCGSKKHSTNPTDALIDLLIFIKVKERHHE